MPAAAGHAAAVAQLAAFVRAHPRLAVLTGAGCSTASGIPAYRDADGAWAHPPPVQYAEFRASAAMRRRYWARSALGWRRVAAARPNAAHQALATLEAAGHVQQLVTQNVDGLHTAAGSRRVIDLHGRLDRVRCPGCGYSTARAAFQARLEAANPAWTAGAVQALAPDGDALPAAPDDDFSVPACPDCGGWLQPDVVFFGDVVPAERTAAALAAVAAADALLVVGSSLMVFSGFRFAREAARLGRPVAMVNQGRSRADDLLQLKLAADCTVLLPALAAALAPAATPGRAAEA